MFKKYFAKLNGILTENNYESSFCRQNSISNLHSGHGVSSVHSRSYASLE
jgi:hypothetical protein